MIIKLGLQVKEIINRSWPAGEKIDTEHQLLQVKKM